MAAADHEDLIRQLATALRTELWTTHIILEPDLPGVPPEDQVMTKVSILVTACNALVEAARSLNQKIGPTEGVVEEKEEEKKEWN